jgi:SOS-response transcriptional repressor LexA
LTPKTKNGQIVYARRFGEVGAGSVVPFIPRDDYEEIILPPGTVDDGDEIGILTVRGVSLEEEHIFDGDELICRLNFSLSEIGPETICLVKILSTGEKCLKKLIKEATMVCLRASGGGVRDRLVQPDDIQVLGLAIRAQRSLEDTIRKGRKPKKKIRPERHVVLDFPN